MIKELTAHQRLFAAVIFEAMDENPQLRKFLTTVASGKTEAWNSLEAYLSQNNRELKVQRFQDWLSRREPIDVTYDFNDKDSSKTIVTEIQGWRPKIVREDGLYLSEYYGITEERRLELCDQLQKLLDTLTMRVTTVSSMIDQIADFCNNAEEFTFCVHINAIYLEKIGANLT